MRAEFVGVALGCGGRPEVGVVGDTERGEEVPAGGREVSELGLPPPWTTNGLTVSMMLVDSVVD